MIRLTYCLFLFIILLVINLKSVTSPAAQEAINFLQPRREFIDKAEEEGIPKVERLGRLYEKRTAPGRIVVCHESFEEISRMKYGYLYTTEEKNPMVEKQFIIIANISMIKQESDDGGVIKEFQNIASIVGGDALIGVNRELMQGKSSDKGDMLWYVYKGNVARFIDADEKKKVKSVKVDTIDKIGDGASKGYVEFFPGRVDPIRVAYLTVYSLRDNKKKCITTVPISGYFGEKARLRIAEIPGEYEYLLKLGTARKRVRVKIVNNMLTPVGIQIIHRGAFAYGDYYSLGAQTELPVPITIVKDFEAGKDANTGNNKNKERKDLMKNRRR